VKIQPVVFFLLVSLFPGDAQAGVYLKIDSATMDYASFIVVHPLGYDGTGGKISLKVCPKDPDFKNATLAIIELWNTLMSETENCKNCLLLDDEPSNQNPEDFFDLTSILLHEVGHCAMGLGHTNWPGTSFTATQSAVAIDEGTDMVRGSHDDSVTPFPGSRVVHWFREADNNPIIIDGTPIDGATYTRRFQDFPAGSSWPANANRDVAEALVLLRQITPQLTAHGSGTTGTRQSPIREGSVERVLCTGMQIRYLSISSCVARRAVVRSHLM